MESRTRKRVGMEFYFWIILWPLLKAVYNIQAFWGIPEM